MYIRVKICTPINSHILATSLKTQLTSPSKKKNQKEHKKNGTSTLMKVMEVPPPSRNYSQHLQVLQQRRLYCPDYLLFQREQRKTDLFKSASHNVDFEDLPEADFDLTILKQERLNRVNQSIGLISDHLHNIAEERNIRIRLADNPQEIAEIISEARNKAVRLGGHLHRLQQLQQAHFSPPSTSYQLQQPQPAHFNPSSTSSPDPFVPRRTLARSPAQLPAPTPAPETPDPFVRRNQIQRSPVQQFDDFLLGNNQITCSQGPAP